MKNNWETKKLGEVLKLEYGKPLEDRNPNGKYPVYGANGEKTRTDKFYYNKPSIVVGRKGSAGEINLTEEKFWALDVTYFVTFDESKYDLNFLYNTLLTLELPKLAKGVKPGINRNEVYDLKVTIPPLPEQQRIVAILDEAFAAIGRAKENAEKNLQNARELFDSYLQSVFANPGDGWEEKTLGEVCSLITDGKHGDCQNENNSGYYFLSAKDVKNNTLNYENARQITKSDFEETHRRTNLEPGDVLVTNSGTIGRMAIAPFDDKTYKTTFQKSVAVLKPILSILDNLFCCYQLRADLKTLVNVSAGTAQKNLLLGDLRRHLISIPSVLEQQHIVEKLDTLSAETKKLENIYRQKINDLDELKKSILQKAFNGELTANNRVSNVIEFPVRIPNISATDLQAGIVATAFQRHQESGKVLTFGHVKAEKIVHLTQELLNIELEREPVKDAAGPNDFKRLKFVESRADKAGFFYTNKQGYGGYTYTPGNQFDNLIEKTKTALNDKYAELTDLIDLLVPMDTQQAELVATVYAAWNNLLIDNQPITDEAIVTEARENWHEDKLKIERQRFFKTIGWMKQNNLIPKGKGKKVSARSAKA